MTVRYMGPGGSDAADGLSWPTRKLTVNGVEDSPATPSDLVWMGAGAYRELWTLDVNGTAGNPITYVADITGEHTDGIGGLVRISGANPTDTGSARTQCVYAPALRSYRTFRGIWFDTPSTYHAYFAAGADNVIFEDCAFTDGPNGGDTLEFIGTTTNCTIRRCTFMGEQGKHVVFYNTGTAVTASNNRVENNIFLGGGAACVYWQGVYDGSVINNLFFAFGRGVQVSSSNHGHPCLVYENNFAYGGEALRGVNVGDITEDYNNFYGNGGNVFNTTGGGNSSSTPLLLNPLMLLSGFKLPQYEPWSLSQYSKIATVNEHSTAANRTTIDLYGMTKPPYVAFVPNRSIGPVQYRGGMRSTARALGGAASLGLRPGGLHVVRRVPISATATTIALWVYWDSSYDSGGPFTKPRMVIKQPGQADRLTTATGSSGSWQQLSDTLTPSALPPYVDVCVESSSPYEDGSPHLWVDSLTVA